jgi:peptidoglycan biosynthesis protein MviN/MurJ (putative lipid II flippase)
MNKKQKTYLSISISLVAAGLLLSTLYRPYIYKNQLSDFGFADTIGSLISVIAFCFFVWSFKIYSKAQMNQHIIIATITYAFLWEFAGLLGFYGTFDWKDIVAGLISGALTYCVKEIIEKRYKVNHETQRTQPDK